MTNRMLTVERYLDGSLSDDEAREFAAGLVHDPAAVDALIESATMDELLREHVAVSRDLSPAGELQTVFEQDLRAGPTAAGSGGTAWSHRGRWTALIAGLAAVCLAVVGWIGSGWRTGPAGPVPAGAGLAAATLARSANVEWVEGAHRWSVGETVHGGDEVRLSDGRVELVFDSGAVMTLAGPATLRVHSPLVASLDYGTATTRIENLQGGEFRVLTRSAEVIDQGTQFGVKVQPNGETDVVVFDGEVDLVPGSGRAGDRHRLGIGEGIRMNLAGVWERIVSIDNGTYPFGDEMFQFHPQREPVIAGVSDDRRSPASPKFYRICHAGLGEDVKAFVDRPFEWNGVTTDGMPAFLLGADYVQTFNDDKDQSCPLITVELARPCMLYIFYDDRMIVPEWLSENFEDTGLKMGLDEGVRSLGVGPGVSIDQICSIWQRRIERPGFVELGLIGDVKDSQLADKYPSQRTMFGIAAQPLQN